MNKYIDELHTIEHGQLKITGVSWSGYKTAILVEPYNILFDIGFCNHQFSKANRVFVSHVHSDHVSAMHQYLRYR